MIGTEATGQFEIISKIGQGGYGIVYKACEISTKDIVAIKQVKKASSNREGFPIAALREIILLKDLKGSPNIIDLRNVLTYELDRNVYIIYNYSEYDMNTLIYQKTPMNFRQVKSYFKQMITGLLSLHSNSYIHRDIKPSNFLISSDNLVTLIDFGLTRKVHGANTKITRRYTDFIGTYSYRAPEIILGATNYGPEIDIWSLGCTLYEMITCQNLFDGCNTEADIANSIIEIFGFPSDKEWPEFYNLPTTSLFLKSKGRSSITTNQFFERKIPDEFKPMKTILLKMLQLNPKNRISLLDALNDPFFSDAELPENLPLLSFEESTHKKSQEPSYKKDFNDFKKPDLQLLELRPPMAMPVSVV